MNQTVREHIDKAIDQRVWAIVGASNDTTKYGNRIYKNLRSAGYKVYPVNPTETTIEGDPAYPTLADLPEKPAVADIVVPAAVGMSIANDAAQAGIEYFWLQPGAESAELIAHAQELGLSVIHDACAMVEKRTWTS